MPNDLSPKFTPTLLRDRTGQDASNADMTPPVRSEVPDWREDLTASMRANCIAPSDDVIQRCFDLYVDELHAPILELEDELVDLSAEVSDGFAALESLLPQEMRQALSRRAAELAYDGEENPEW